MMKILEVCVDSIDSAIQAKIGGATRLELCANIVIGGTTPSIYLFHFVRTECNLPVHVLIRPRSGDFCYNELDFRIMFSEIQEFKHAGAAGVAIGALTPEGSLHMKYMEKMCKMADGMSITLHRAFDMCKDPIDTLNKAAELGIDTILTSGQKNHCIDGVSLIKKLVKLKKADIMVGGGVTPDVLQEIKKKTGATSYHLTGKKIIDSKMTFRNPDVSLGIKGMNEYESWVTCAETIAEVRKSLFSKTKKNPFL